ncbi:hypothetical protein BDV96DRAFT_287015 [Lophiotrema nucula]|uniref:Caspase domain-containing protein n=1 Tax=Lophiotrema nucula TaxID=690887 RepID=A0A6A5YNT9_9PLEO|nr:hypothetical protein BDV96DRAFT_287015 [Lophiotrema nucula]
MQQDIACSKYTSVKTLLLYWELRDPGLKDVKREVYELQQVFTNDFCFDTEIWELPCNGNVERELTSKLFDFKQDTHEKELLILYYGGHAGNQGGSCTWHAGIPGHSVEWNNIAQLLTSNVSDVLFILDCCEATSAVAAFSGGQARHGANWLLASSGINSEAAGVSRTDFTQLMIRTLKDMANDFYENDLPKITSEDVHTALHLNHWEQLVTNAVHVRLNRRSCSGIDLTPLVTRSGRRPSEDGFKYQLEYPISKTSILPRKGFLDVILVPGGDGNPVTSFMARSKKGNCMWPHDVLCPRLESRRILYRLLPFQHHWTGHGYGVGELKQFVQSSKALEDAVYDLWKADPRRPLLFIAYGRGCTVVRRALHYLYRRRGKYCSPWTRQR